jgi:hypothetical protein
MFRKFENMQSYNDISTREERSIKQMKEKVERLKNLLSKKQTPVIKKKKKKFKKKSGRQSILKKKKGEPKTIPFHQLRNGVSTKKMNQLAVPSEINKIEQSPFGKENFEGDSQLMKPSPKKLSVKEIRLEMEEGNGNHLTRRDLLLMNQELIKQLRNEGEEKYSGKVEELEKKVEYLEAERQRNNQKRIQVENQLFGNEDFMRRLGEINQELKSQLAGKDRRILEIQAENEKNKFKLEEQKQGNGIMRKKLESLEVVVGELESRREKLRETLKKGVDKEEDVWVKNFDLEETNLVLVRENKVLVEENRKIKAELSRNEEQIRKGLKEIENERSRREIVELKLVMDNW